MVSSFEQTLLNKLCDTYCLEAQILHCFITRSDDLLDTLVNTNTIGDISSCVQDPAMMGAMMTMYDTLYLDLYPDKDVIKSICAEKVLCLEQVALELLEDMTPCGDEQQTSCFNPSKIRMMLVNMLPIPLNLFRNSYVEPNLRDEFMFKVDRRIIISGFNIHSNLGYNNINGIIKSFNIEVFMWF